MGTAIKHPVLDAHPWASECPDVKNYKWRLNPVWHRMLYSSTHMITVDVKGLIYLCWLRHPFNVGCKERRYFLLPYATLIAHYLLLYKKT